MDIFGNLFGDKGLVGSVMGVLKTVGIVKDPEMQLKISESLQKLEVELKGKAIELEAVHAGDRASAREREKVLRDKTPSVLATVAIGGLFSVLTLLIFFDIPEAAHDPLMFMLGVLSALVTGVTNYYFGSSSGSAQKNTTIHSLLKR